jgi:ABC-type lipoprotein export system ATPase subunit/GNAT superfamily N-acetyltransferase
VKITVECDEITNEISRIFDYQFDGTSSFEPHRFKPIDYETTLSDFSIGLIVGPSGSGKTTLLKDFGEEVKPTWYENKPIVSHFKDVDDAQNRLGAVGFNSIPSWMRPYHVLSNGEQFRARLARQLDSNIVVDEFTSVIDRDVAKSCSNAISRYVKRNNLKNIVFSSCHYDIIEWLQPDWVFDTQTGNLTTRRYHRPDIVLEIQPCTTKAWTHFRHHHYLTGDLNTSSLCWITTWNGRLVGFLSSISMPSGTLKKAWRGHRTVVLPEFQGLGIGARMTDALGDIHLAEGKRFYTKTSHPRLGEYREKSDRWRPTSHNKKSRPDYKDAKPNQKAFGVNDRHADRVCYSHEYIGESK